MNRSVHNILRVYDQADANELREGLEWYANAHEAAKMLHRDIRVGSAIVAALSPGLRWERNLEAARRVIAGESLDGIGVRWFANVRKAEEIAMGGDPERILGGLKVRCFWRLIESPKCPLFVCIDGHAFAIAMGQRITTQDTPKITPRMYAMISARYTAAADTAGVLPLQMQAVTWVVWRRLHNVADGGNGHEKNAA